MLSSSLPSFPPWLYTYSNSGLEVKSYNYYDSSTCGLDSSGLYQDLNVSIHTCKNSCSVYIHVHVMYHTTLHRVYQRSLLCCCMRVHTTQLEWTPRYVYMYIHYACWLIRSSRWYNNAMLSTHSSHQFHRKKVSCLEREWNPRSPAYSTHQIQGMMCFTCQTPYRKR